MKYRVKFKCYWYNTGASDNHHYTNFEDFDTLFHAQAFADKVKKQIEVYKSGTFEERQEWELSGNLIDIENGFISGSPIIVKHYPEREESL